MKEQDRKLLKKINSNNVALKKYNLMGDTVRAELTQQAKTALKQISTFLLYVKCSHNYYISSGRTI